MAHARTRFAPASRALAHEEDIALSAFDTLCRGAAADVEAPSFPFSAGQTMVFRFTVLGEGHTQAHLEFERLKMTWGP